MNRAKFKRGSEIKRLRKRVGFPPKTEMCLEKSDPEEEAMEPATPPLEKKKPASAFKTKVSLKRTMKTPNKGESSQKKPKTK